LFAPALILGSSGLAWTLAPAPVPPNDGPATGESWNLPQIQRREPAKWAAALGKNSLWGGEAAGPTGTVTAGSAKWSITGTVIKGPEAFALIAVGDGPSKQYRVGDSIPDGAKILRIEEDRLHVTNNGAESVLEVYRK
jgi:hypothetical protein